MPTFEPNIYLIKDITHPEYNTCHHHNKRSTKKTPDCVHNQAMSLMWNSLYGDKINNPLYIYPDKKRNAYPAPTDRLLAVINPNKQVIAAARSVVHKSLGNIGILTELAVKHSHRGQGIGSLLIATCEELYKPNDIIIFRPLVSAGNVFANNGYTTRATWMGSLVLLNEN